MKNLLKLPKWSIVSLIVLTMVLSVVILIKIWFPQFLDEDIFIKILFTYFVLIVSSSVIAKMTAHLQGMDTGDEE